MTNPVPLAWTIVVTDGAVLRTLHPAGLGETRAGAIERIVRDHLFPPDAVAQPAPGPRPLAPSAAHAPTPSDETRRRAIARAQGYSGDLCDACGNSEMKRSGTCLTCQNCGATTGCS